MTHAPSRTAGALFLLTHVTSIAAVALYGGSALASHPSLSRTNAITAALLEVILAAAVLGTAVALHPLLRRHGEGLSIAYVALRTLEASVILAGVVTVLPAVAAPGTTALPGLDAHGLLLVHDWTFVVGPGLVCPINTVVLAWLLHRERLAPRFVTLLGLVGGPLIGLVNVGILYGVTPAIPLAAVPIFAWEVSLALYLIVRGIPLRTRPAAELAAVP